MSTKQRFAALVDEFAPRPGVESPGEGRGFGSTALKVNGSIFAMCPGEHLVVKLPSGRVAELIVSGVGAPFDAGKGRQMKQWLTVLDQGAWSALADEALRFVGSQRR